MGIRIKFIKILLLLYLLRIHGFARLAPISLISISFFFFFGESTGFYFQYIGLFFLVGLLVTIFSFFLFKILFKFFRSEEHTSELQSP